MSQEQRIVRVRRVDGDAAGFALVSAAAIGPHPLDLVLVATEGENAYRATSKPQMTSFLAPSSPFHPRLCLEPGPVHNLGPPPQWLPARRASAAHGLVSFAPPDLV